MDNTEKMKRYRRILQETIEHHAQMATEPPQPDSFVVCDTVHDHYLLMDVGWEANKRAHYIVIHLRLKDGKVHIEEDGIEYGIARDLINAGIPAEDIVDFRLLILGCGLAESVAQSGHRSPANPESAI